jgi:hypothetical protein
MNKIALYIEKFYDKKYTVNGFSNKFLKKTNIDSFNFITSTSFLSFIEDDEELNKDQYFKHVELNSNEKYFYPIFWPQVSFSALLENLRIPKRVIHDINNKRAKILLVNTYEGYSLTSFDNDIDYISKKFKINKDSIVLTNGNLKLINRKNSVYYNHWENVFEHYQRNNIDLMSIYMEKFLRNQSKLNKFICLLRRPHVHRIALFTDMFEFKDEGILTLGKGDYVNNFLNLEQNFLQKFPDKEKSLLKIKHLLPYEYDVNLSKDNPTHDNQIEKYFDSYLHIVSETYFLNNEEQIFFSEKIFKPVIFFQPFILFSQAGSLQEFKKLGFKTFETFIDETYDDIKDDRDRYDAALKSTLKFINQDKKIIHKQVRDMYPILMHNYSLLAGRRTFYKEKVFLELKSELENS